MAVEVTAAVRVLVAEQAGLNERELQLLHRMAQGMSNRDIGADLYLSVETVKTHARKLFRKLGVGDRAHAVAVGFLRGILA